MAGLKRTISTAFLALFVATLVAQMASAYSWKNQFLDLPVSYENTDNQAVEYPTKWQKMLKGMPRIAPVYHGFYAWYHKHKALRHEKKSGRYGMRAAWIGIGLGTMKKQIAQTYATRTDFGPSADKPLLITFPFRKIWDLKNYIFDSLTRSYQRSATEHYERAQAHRKKQEYHTAQGTLLTQSILIKSPEAPEKPSIQ